MSAPEASELAPRHKGEPDAVDNLAGELDGREAIPSPVESQSRLASALKAAVVSVAQRGLIPRRLAARIVGSRWLKGA